MIYPQHAYNPRDDKVTLYKFYSYKNHSKQHCYLDSPKSINVKSKFLQHTFGIIWMIIGLYRAVTK